jgi:hypothetical protein
MRSNSMLKVVAVLCIACLTMARAHADQQPRARFLIDDPMMADDDAAVDAGGVRVDPLGAYADFVLNTFLSPGDKRPIPAVNVNTLGEVPDSSWFTNRIGARRVTIDEIVRGPNQLDRLDITDWVIVQGKNTGRQAGFRAVSASDPTGRVYQIEFDPREHPEMASSRCIWRISIRRRLRLRRPPPSRSLVARGGSRDAISRASCAVQR